MGRRIGADGLDALQSSQIAVQSLGNRLVIRSCVGFIWLSSLLARHSLPENCADGRLPFALNGLFRIHEGLRQSCQSRVQVRRILHAARTARSSVFIMLADRDPQLAIAIRSGGLPNVPGHPQTRLQGKHRPLIVRRWATPVWPTAGWRRQSRSIFFEVRHLCPGRPGRPVALPALDRLGHTLETLKVRLQYLLYLVRRQLIDRHFQVLYDLIVALSCPATPLRPSRTMGPRPHQSVMPRRQQHVLARVRGRLLRPNRQLHRIPPERRSADRTQNNHPNRQPLPPSLCVHTP